MNATHSKMKNTLSGIHRILNAAGKHKELKSVIIENLKNEAKKITKCEGSIHSFVEFSINSIYVCIYV